MKRKTPFQVLIALFISTSAIAQVNDTVSVGPGYANQTWYTISDGSRVSSANNNWDLAFEIKGYTATILVNTAAGNSLWAAPNKIANESDFLSLDTVGITNWTTLYNSDTSLSVGAFNKNISTNPNDIGWGIYNMTTHNIVGDSLFVIKLSNGTYKKLWIISLSSGVYNFRYANLNNTNDTTVALSKSGFIEKNFGYYSIQSNLQLDREPVISKADLIFTKYTAFIPTPYSVTGVLLNKGVKAIKARGVDVNTVSVDQYSFVNTSNTIGYDWKRFDFTLGYVIEDSLAFFVKPLSGNIYKLIFTGFGGSANGNFMFNTEEIPSTNVTNESNENIASVAVYPNPIRNDNINLIFDILNTNEKANISIIDLTGNVIYNEESFFEKGLHQHTIASSILNAGIYFINITIANNSITKKIIKY